MSIFVTINGFKTEHNSTDSVRREVTNILDSLTLDETASLKISFSSAEPESSPATPSISA